MARAFYITTAIDYTNATPHIGHAYEKVLADVIARYHRLKGDEIFFLTGVDQHGQKVQQSAERQGIPPQKFVDKLTETFRELWQALDIDYTAWAATTDERHKNCVRAILQRLWGDKGDDGVSRWIYKTKQGGWYSIRQEQFLTDKERGPDGEFGPEWGEVEFREEENYYFRLSEYREWLLALIDRREDFVLPSFRRGELRNAAEKLSGDLCISRPKSRLSWGIEFPFDPEFVTYVWFDALVNYISFAPGYDPDPSADLKEFGRWWPALHVIGKDILIPAHGVYWPVMLKALGFGEDEMPKLLVHGWWNVAGAKISKSLGNSVDPKALADKYGSETLRYYLMSNIATGKDADFSEERIIQCYNSELANSIGNLLNRTLTMAQKYREGRLRKVETNALPDHPATRSLRQIGEHDATMCVASFAQQMEEYRPDAALTQASTLALSCNGLVELSAPWKLAKQTDLSELLDAVLYHLAESLRIIAILLSPVLPKAARGMLEQLGLRGEFLLDDARWGLIPDGHMLAKPFPLFPRIEAHLE